MDLQRDYAAFAKLIGRLCATLDKFCTDELVESWWKALRHVDLAAIERRVDEFLARATETTKFPRPSQMRDPNQAQTAIGDGVNYQRGYWRSCIVASVAKQSGHTFESLEPVIVANRDSLGRAMLDMLNDYAGFEPNGLDRIGLLDFERKVREMVRHSVLAPRLIGVAA